MANYIDMPLVEELPANIKEPLGPVSCDCKDHLDKLEGEIEVSISAKKLFEYLFSDDQTGPAGSGGVWNKMNAAKGNSGKCWRRMMRFQGRNDEEDRREQCD